jgi:hypothetical protein
MSGSVGPQASAGLSPTGFRLGDELRGERATLGKSLLDVQRELRIKASFIAAIEDMDLAAFPNPGVIGGFVRSYARYLHLDPEEVFRRFCLETGHQPPQRLAAASVRPGQPGSQIRMEFPLAEPARRGMPAIPFAAIGSALVLVGLILGLGYGAWTVLQNIQRVEFAPVEEVPAVLAEVAPLAQPEALPELVLPDLAQPVAAVSLADLYRQQELEVPILVPRDGPIAALDPERVGLLARDGARPGQTARPGDRGVHPRDEAPADFAEAAEIRVGEPLVSVEETRPRLVVMAERPAWIRIYYQNGTILFERILESGESYVVPDTEEPPMIWAGNSGSVYVRIGDSLHGPIGRGTRAARDIPLDPAALTERFEIVADIPNTILDAIGRNGGNGATLVQ